MVCLTLILFITLWWKVLILFLFSCCDQFLPNRMKKSKTQAILWIRYQSVWPVSCWLVIIQIQKNQYWYVDRYFQFDRSLLHLLIRFYWYFCTCWCTLKTNHLLHSIPIIVIVMFQWNICICLLIESVQALSKNIIFLIVVFLIDVLLHGVLIAY